ncbi:MAG: hypothetical protein FWG74_08830, partial [Planctomycetes bacterium]|nr:hypothetical protein [Planctomycetota bacterium]
YTTHIHGLKSAAMNVGAKKISNFARALEDAGLGGAHQFILDNSEVFFGELEGLLHRIGSVLDGEKLAEPEPGAEDSEFLKQSLDKLKNALENTEAKQINDIINDLESRTWNQETEEFIGELSNLVLLFEYGEAIALIDKL